jgi:hypothetical protein
MSVVFSIKEGDDGLWCIYRGAERLFSHLNLAVAIKQARTLGRDTHATTGMNVSVEISSPEFTTTLAQYASPGPDIEGAAA